MTDIELSSPEVPEIIPQIREIFDETIAEAGPPPHRRPRRWPWLAAATVTVAAGGAVAVLLLTGGSATPHVNVACQHATAVQNTFVESAVADGYPNVSIDQVMLVQAEDLKLLADMTKAGCPGNTRIDILPEVNL